MCNFFTICPYVSYDCQNPTEHVTSLKSKTKKSVSSREQIKSVGRGRNEYVIIMYGIKLLMILL